MQSEITAILFINQSLKLIIKIPGEKIYQRNKISNYSKEKKVDVTRVFPPILV